MYMLFKPSGRHRTALRMLDPRRDDAVLDVGCNAGYFEHYFLRGKVARAVGVDIDDAALQFARDNVHDVEFYRSSSSSLPFDAGTFDKVLCADVLEHVDDEAGTLDEIHRVLKPGGLLVLSTPNDFLNTLDPGYPEHRHYSAAALTAMLERAGFTVEKVHRTSLVPHLVTFMLRFGRTPALLRLVRRLTGAVEDLDHLFNLGFGFTIAVSARSAPVGSPRPGAAREGEGAALTGSAA